MKKINWIVLFFLLGNIMLISTTCVISFFTPDMLLDRDDLQDQISALEDTIWNKQQLMNEYDLWESKTLDYESTLLFLESVNLNNTPNYERMKNDLKIARSTALSKLERFLDVDPVSWDAWEKMDLSELEGERITLLKKTSGMIQALKNKKTALEDSDDDLFTKVSFTNFLTALFQTVAIAFIALSDFIEKRQAA